MKGFRRKYEYKMYIVVACLIALCVITGSYRATGAKRGVLSNGFSGREGVLEVAVDPSDIHFEKDAQGVYDAYSPEKLALAKDHKVILFFKADWCPSCRTADETLNKEFASIPKNIAILKVSYDTETELRKKYGVTIQHTFVQVDSQGNLITKWLGSVSIGEILERVR